MVAPNSLHNIAPRHLRTYVGSDGSTKCTAFHRPQTAAYFLFVRRNHVEGGFWTSADIRRVSQNHVWCCIWTSAYVHGVNQKNHVNSVLEGVVGTVRSPLCYIYINMCICVPYNPYITPHKYLFWPCGVTAGSQNNYLILGCVMCGVGHN